MSQRTNYDIKFELEYATRSCGLHETLWRRINIFFMFVTAFGATTAATGFIKQSPELAAVSGLILAVVSVLNMVLNPAARGKAYKVDGKRYTALRPSVVGLDDYSYDEKLDKKLQDLHVNDEPEIKAISALAYREAMTRLGHEDKESLGLMPRLISVIA